MQPGRQHAPPQLVGAILERHDQNPAALEDVFAGQGAEHGERQVLRVAEGGFPDAAAAEQ